MLSTFNFRFCIMDCLKPLVLSALFAWLLFVSGQASSAMAQGSAAETQPVVNEKLEAKRLPAPKTLQIKVVTKPAWKDLSPAQQEALKPLNEHWNNLSDERRRKWLELSKNYPSLSPDEQAKLHSRMATWVTLSQQQRTQARLNYTESKKLSPEEKAKEWEAYQALSPEEKKKLADKALSKPVGAAVIKSIPSPKLANVPVTPLAKIPGSRLAAAKQPIQEKTLLPHPEDVQTEATSEPSN
jgi:hypothetical protein